MCYHKYYIFTACGHGFFAPKILLHCPEHRQRLHPHTEPLTSPLRTSVLPSPRRRQSSDTSQTCPPRAHPYQTIRLHDTICLHCATKRYTRLQQAEENLEVVKFEERKWRVSYASSHNVLLASPSEAEMVERERWSQGRTGYSGSRASTNWSGSDIVGSPLKGGNSPPSAVPEKD